MAHDVPVLLASGLRLGEATEHLFVRMVHSHQLSLNCAVQLESRTALVAPATALGVREVAVVLGEQAAMLSLWMPRSGIIIERESKRPSVE
jgi:hypothetical protein